MMENDKRLLYKYRSLQDFKRLMDILINNRLYAAPYSKLNDIREGIYSHNGTMTKIKIDEIKLKKERLKICSLSSNNNSSTMWTHYADNHEGVCLEVEIVDKGASCEEVIYGSILKNAENYNSLHEEAIAKKVLTCKEECWRCEEEVRVFKNGESSKKTFVKILVKKVILGKDIKPDDRNLIESIIGKINSCQKNNKIKLEANQ